MSEAICHPCTARMQARLHTHLLQLGCIQKQTKKISVPTETNRFDLFRENKNKKFQFGLVFRTYIETTKTIEQTELFSNEPKQTETTLNFLKNTQICSLSNCLGWSSVCFDSFKTSKLTVSV